MKQHLTTIADLRSGHRLFQRPSPENQLSSLVSSGLLRLVTLKTECGPN
jgi:hypothetical protein